MITWNKNNKDITIKFQNCEQVEFINVAHVNGTILTLGKLTTKLISETHHRDKYIKVKIRYSGEDLALIQ
jgi:hypothetical protein